MLKRVSREIASCASHGASSQNFASEDVSPLVLLQKFAGFKVFELQLLFLLHLSTLDTRRPAPSPSTLLWRKTQHAEVS